MFEARRRLLEVRGDGAVGGPDGDGLDATGAQGLVGAKTGVRPEGEERGVGDGADLLGELAGQVGRQAFDIKGDGPGQRFGDGGGPVVRDSSDASSTSRRTVWP